MLPSLPSLCLRCWPCAGQVQSPATHVPHKAPCPYAAVQALESNETLTYLDLSNNGLDDDKVGTGAEHGGGGRGVGEWRGGVWG